MHRIFSLFLSLALFNILAVPSYGAEKATGTTLNASTTSQDDSPSRFHITLGGGLAYHNSDVARSQNTSLGKYGEVADFGFYFQVSPNLPLSLGLDFGLNHWGVRTTTTTSSNISRQEVDAYVLPVLPTIMYSFEVTRVFHPFIGVSAGPALYLVTTTTSKGLFSEEDSSSSDSRIVFEALVRPGADLQFSKHIGLRLEPRIGILDGNAIFMSNTAVLFSF